jgi:sigma-B regulation protein RsbU (phosphoserine phosphatase)
MEAEVLDKVQEGLSEKRNQVSTWMQTTPARKKQAYLGPADERAVEAHLDVLDTALDKAAAGILAVCTVCHQEIEPELLQMDYTRGVCLDDLAPEEKRLLEFELELAQSVQRSLLPQEVPEIPGLEVAAFSRPAQIVGGDYFDFFRWEDGTHGLAIADVAGHGISASLHMASIQTLLRTLVPASPSPLPVVQELQRLLLHNVHFSTFVTLFLAALDPATGRLTYCNAGHPPPLILHPEGDVRGSIRWLEPTGAAVALIEGLEFEAASTLMQPGDLLLLYTDGLTEAMNPNGELFGRERLGQLAGQASTVPARELLQILRRGMESFIEDRSLGDDVTIVVCRNVNGS